MGEILEELPLRYAAFSTCFRREAGAAGKDTRGMFRVHQFNKVELFVFCEPERSSDEHDRLLAIEEELVQALGLPYRVVNVAAGDLGASAAKKYDIEAWFPSQQRYREITSTSNTTDFQARRLGIRYRRGEKRLETPHTLNGRRSRTARCSRCSRTSAATCRTCSGVRRAGASHEVAGSRRHDDGRLVTRTRRGARAVERAVLKTVGRASVPWVRIPPPPLSRVAVCSAQVGHSTGTRPGRGGLPSS